MPAHLQQSQQAAINQAAAGTQTIAAVSGKRIVVVSAYMSVLTTGTVTLQSGSTAAVTTGATDLAVGTPLVLPYNPDGWFSTVAGESLKIILATGTQLQGSINYVVM